MTRVIITKTVQDQEGYLLHITEVVMESTDSINVLTKKAVSTLKEVNSEHKSKRNKEQKPGSTVA